MKKSIIEIIMLYFLFLLLLSACSNGRKNNAEIPQWAQNVDKQVKGWVKSQSVLGAELLIIKDGETIINNVYGWNDNVRQQSLDKNQLYRVHSMTKPFTGTAILMLSEQGKIDLNDRVAKYLDAYKNEKCNEITIRQLLEHTAGFTQPAYPKGSIDLYKNLQEAVTDLTKEGPKYIPGEQYHYSDGHSATLGLIVTEISGMPVERFISDKIFEPLEMNDSYCVLPDADSVRERVCDTYFWKEGKYVKLWDNFAEPETPFFRASGGIATTVNDYAKFLDLWLHKGSSDKVELLSESTVSEALTTNNIHNSYGWHWEIYQPAADKHTLPVFGHGGSSGTLALALPHQNAMIFYFTQSRGTLTANFLPTLILEELGYKEKKSIPEIEVSKAVYDKYLGEFQVSSEIWRVEKTERGLSLKSGRLVPLEFLPVSDSVFVQRFMDMKLEFLLDKKNECNKFIFNIGERAIEAPRYISE